jgi:catechol 2,3-dioxygenase-like lactoylglutathione lyase family enzyme
VGLQNTKVLATFFKLPNNTGLIETFQYVHPEGRPVRPDYRPNDGGWGHLCFQVEDIEKTCRELQSRGIEFLSTPVTISRQHPHFAGVRFCYLLGPDNEVLEILQP